jgi:nicotinamide-nucleotide amidase
VFATLEASIAAYHLAFGQDDYLYVTGPTTSSYDSIHRISPAGEVETYYRGLGRPQGMAFDAEGRLYVAGSLGGRRGVVRFDPDRNPELFLSGPGIVGLAFTPSRSLLVTTNSSLFRADVGISGRPLPYMPDAEIIAVGSELLTPQRLDTNSLYLTDQLNSLGVEVVRKTVVGDERERLTDTILGALARSQIIVLTGGLGPTEDDLTRDAVATALGRTMIFRQDICDLIEERFRRFQRKMVEINRRQAYIVEGAAVLPNDRGTAPGQWIEHQNAVLMLLPGPPNELKSMFEMQCLPRLEKFLPPQVIRTLLLRVVGMPESDLDQLISPIYMRYPNLVTTILAVSGEIHIHLRARFGDAQQAEALIAEVAGQIEPLIGDRVYSRNGDSLEEVIGDLLLARSARLSVAESATGGLLGARITAVPGSSNYFVGGFLTYTDSMKTALLGVPPEMLAEHSAVSEPVAKAMAEGAAQRTGSDYALSITGYAGPDGEKVGLFFIGLTTPHSTEARRIQLPGDRERMRAFSTNTALDILRRNLLAG